jgi:hypothetical protein
VKRAVLIGQSHCNAIAEALSGRSGDDHEIAIFRIGEECGPDGAPFTFSTAVPMIAQLPEGTPIFLSVLGGYHNYLGLLESGERYDFLLDPDDAAEATATALVPHRALSSAMEAAFDSAEKIHKLKAASKSPVYVLSTPPTKQSNEFITARLMAQKKKVYRGRSFLEFGVERPEIRRKLWLLEARLLAAWAERGGMAFVPAPAAAFNEDGFLDQQFYDDATHANAGYGALVVDQIEAILAGEEVNG